MGIFPNGKVKNMTAISFDIAHFGETTETLRKAEVSSENKRSDWGRETLCGFFSERMDEGTMTATLLAILKPRKPNGKAGDTLSSLRYAKGGDAIRKAAVTCLDIYEAASKGPVAAEFRPVAIAFATAAPNAPKSLNALKAELTKLRKEASKAASDAADNAGNDADSDNDETVDKVPLAVMAERMALAISEASEEDILAADEQLTSLLEAIRNAYAATGEEQREAA
jgi:hypothetical protein